MATRFDIRFETLSEILGNEVKIGSDDEFVALERRVGTDDVDGLRPTVKGVVIALQDCELVVLRRVLLPINRPAALVVIEKRDFGSNLRTTERALGRGEFLRGLRHFLEQRNRFAIRTDQRCV